MSSLDTKLKLKELAVKELELKVELERLRTERLSLTGGKPSQRSKVELSEQDKLAQTQILAFARSNDKFTTGELSESVFGLEKGDRKYHNLIYKTLMEHSFLQRREHKRRIWRNP